MRGHIRQRSEGSWTIVIDCGHVIDPLTGGLRRKQKWVTVRGSKKDAEKKLADLLHAVHHGGILEPSALRLGEWLDRWLETAIQGRRRLRTVETYRSIIATHLKPQLGTIRLGELRPDHIEAYYRRQAAILSPATLELHHVVLVSALKGAVRHRLIRDNPAQLAMNKPHAPDRHDADGPRAWTEDEVRRVLAAAEAMGPRQAAFYALALEAGPRKGELCGLKWDDVNWKDGILTIQRQLVKRWPEPVFGPTKSGRPRTVTLSARTLALLRRLKAHQAAIKLEAATAYQDYGLIFCSEQPPFGVPLSANNLGQREFRRLIAAAQVPAIPFHNLRHTAATLLLKAGVPVKVVAERLGHKDTGITQDIYAHVLPAMQQDAAAKMEAVLYGEPTGPAAAAVR
jgi:integrase